MNPTPQTQPTPPPGGFQLGGWYNGQQYWNGQLGAAGVINNPNQVGYGQPVSAEVNRASSVTQGKDPNAIANYLGNAGQPGGAGVATNAGAGGVVNPTANNGLNSGESLRIVF